MMSLTVFLTFTAMAVVPDWIILLIKTYPVHLIFNSTVPYCKYMSEDIRHSHVNTMSSIDLQEYV